MEQVISYLKKQLNATNVQLNKAKDIGAPRYIKYLSNKKEQFKKAIEILKAEQHDL